MSPSIALATLLAMTTSGQATLVTLSDSNTDSTVGVDQTLTLGDTSTLYLWVTPDPDQTIKGLGLDVVSDSPLVLGSPSITIYNPNNSWLGDTRWQGTPGTGTLGDLIDDSNAVSVTTGTGLMGSNVGQQVPPVPGGTWYYFQDYDGGTVDATGAFLHAEISFEATGLGITNVMPAEGFALVTNSAGDQVFPQYSGGTIEVVPVPEPGSMLALLAGLLLIGLKRRRVRRA